MTKWKKVTRPDLDFRLPIKSARIKRAFMDVWQSLPEADRARLRDLLLVVTDARILADMLNDDTPDAHASALEHTRGGWVICFDAYKLRPARPDYLRFVVAHELAHVYYKHNHKTTTITKGEREANKQAAAWGYPEP